MARKNSIISVSVEGTTVTITTEGVGGSIVQDVKQLSEEIQLNLLLHGFKQKVSDKAAMSKELAATPQMKFDAMRACAEQLAVGEWTTRRGDGTSGIPSLWRRAFGIWIERAAEAKKKPVPTSEAIDEQFEAVGGWAKVKTIPAVAAIADELRAPSAAINGDKLLAGLFA